MRFETILDLGLTKVSSYTSPLQHLTITVIILSFVLSLISSDGCLIPGSKPHTLLFFSFPAQGTERGFYGNEDETMVSFSAESSSCLRGRER